MAIDRGSSGQPVICGTRMLKRVTGKFLVISDRDFSYDDWFVVAKHLHAFMELGGSVVRMVNTDDLSNRFVLVDSRIDPGLLDKATELLSGIPMQEVELDTWVEDD